MKSLICVFHPLRPCPVVMRLAININTTKEEACEQNSAHANLTPILISQLGRVLSNRDRHVV